MRGMQVLLLYSLLLTIEYVAGLGAKTNKRLPPYVMGRPYHGFRPNPVSRESKMRAQYIIYNGTIQQPVDHFNLSDTRKWTQYYYYNLKYYRQGGPIFLMLGGESPEDGWWSVDESIPYIKWAMKFNAAIYDIEHRFYGISRPFPTQTTENLKFLSSRQALEDYASFVKYINQQQGYTNPRWIAFGGSYAGALAAWFREKHPELVMAAVGSSAPVLAQLDFHEYLVVVEKSLRAYNATCADAVQKGFETMAELIWTPSGRAELSNAFALQPRLDSTQLRYKDIEFFFSAIFGNFQGAVQYSNINIGGYRTEGSIPNVCAIMMNSSLTYMDRIKQVNIYMTEFYEQTNFISTFIDYDELIQELRNELYDMYGYDSAFRSWTWQTCTEFGYFQSTNHGRNIFGSVTSSSLYIEMCTDVFGAAYNVQAIENSIHATNKYYGGRAHFTGTNVVFPNGDVDPWHALGLYSNMQPSIVPILVHGTAHCADMYAAAADDLPSLQAARQTIEQNLEKWINGKVTSNAEYRLQKPKGHQFTVKKPKPFTSVLMSLPLKPFKEAISEIEKVPPHVPKFFMGRPIRGFIAEPAAPLQTAEYPPGFVAGTIKMPLDHFDATNINTFEQRYWYNPQYYQPGGPQFLYIGGESTADLKWVTNPDVQIMSAARKFNGAVYMLEHRYYGESWPTPDQSTENMRFLSSKQALADVAQFIITMNRDQQYENPRWVTFGGSYPGMLSAWFRQLYPELSVGALASSAPIEAKVDFYDYLIVVENSLRTYNPNCAFNVKLAFDDLHKLSLTPDGRVQLSNLFTLEPAWTATTKVTYVDIQNFFSLMYGHFQSAVQYNNDNRGAYATGGGMRELCGFMLNTTQTPLQNLVDVNIYMTKFFNGGVFEYTDNLYQNYINYLKDVNAKSSSRSWTYQTCTEFGYYQSTDIGNSIFGSSVPLNFFIDMCADVFGPSFTPDFVFNAVEETQKFYGGRDYYHGTNVLFTNGNIDPWCALSIYNRTGSVTTVMMNGTAHCADTYPPREQDAPDLAPIRQLAEEKIAEWLGQSSAKGLAPSTLCLIATMAVLILFSTA